MFQRGKLLKNKLTGILGILEQNMQKINKQVECIDNLNFKWN